MPVVDSAGAALEVRWVCRVYDVFSVGCTVSAAVVSGLMRSGQREICFTMRRGFDEN